MGNTSSSSPVDLRAADTSSVCATEVDTGAHDFVVLNYSLLDGMGVGKPVDSSMFSVGGHYWCVRFYPDGALKKHEGYAAAVLCLLSGVPAGTGVRAKFTLSLHEMDGQVHRSSTVLSGTRTFKTAGDCLGNAIVHKSNLLPDCCFKIRCDLTVLQNTNVEMTAVPN